MCMFLENSGSFPKTIHFNIGFSMFFSPNPILGVTKKYPPKSPPLGAMPSSLPVARAPARHETLGLKI